MWSEKSRVKSEGASLPKTLNEVSQLESFMIQVTPPAMKSKNRGSLIVGNNEKWARRIWMGFLLVILVSPLILVQSVGAVLSAGNLDPSFGGGGIVTAKFGGANSYNSANAIAIQNDGKLVVGTSHYAGSQYGFTLGRFNPDGSVDASFGTLGNVTTHLGTADAGIYAVAIQPDGKILAAGYAYKGATSADFALARYNPTGVLDNTFGPSSNGTVTTDFFSSYDYAYAIAVQGDGKILLSGEAYTGSNYDFATARYTSGGTLDGSFGTGGKQTTTFGSSTDIAKAVILQSDAKIIVAGYSYTGSAYAFATVRYNTGGTVDTSFGSGGKVTTGIGTSSLAYSAALQPDGKIVLAGYAYHLGTLSDFALARYSPNGSLDNSFGPSGNGTLSTDFVTDYEAANFVAVQGDGKIVAAGYVPGGISAGPGVARYNADGSLDTTFGVGGKVYTYVGSTGGYAGMLAGLLQPDGKIVEAGFAYAADFSSSTLILVRYLGDSADLSVAISEAPSPAVVGNNLTYSVLVSNSGPHAATGVTITDNLPTSASLVSATSSSGSCSGSTVVICHLGTINSGANATVSIVVHPSSVGALGSSITLTSAVLDPNTNDNHASTLTSVVAAPTPPPPPGFLEVYLPWLILVAVIAGFIVAMLLTKPKGPKMGP